LKCEIAEAVGEATAVAVDRGLGDGRDEAKTGDFPCGQRLNQDGAAWLPRFMVFACGDG
jgi:hypothetical protein